MIARDINFYLTPTFNKYPLYIQVLHNKKYSIYISRIKPANQNIFFLINDSLAFYRKQ